MMCTESTVRGGCGAVGKEIRALNGFVKPGGEVGADRCEVLCRTATSTYNCQS